MPDYGRLTQQRLPHTQPAVDPLYPAPPWALPGARVLKLIYETDAEPLLTWLPPKLSRSSPPYAVVVVAHYHKSPIGPFSLATQGIGCRAGFFIRALSVQAITDSPVAMAALRETWGYPCKLGEVMLEQGDDGVSASIRSSDRPLASLSLQEPEPIDGESVRFDPVLNIRSVPSLDEGKAHELLHMVQIDPEITIKESVRGRGDAELLASDGKSGWNALPVRGIVSAVYALIDTELPLARFVVPY
ncbi:MAG: hypothetical protein E6J42_02250 [Chloroflexi bacterium]|nr:MAG: hypothetical protein E6J42_02250 [Chloroflexota bacterium]